MWEQTSEDILRLQAAERCAARVEGRVDPAAKASAPSNAAAAMARPASAYFDIISAFRRCFSKRREKGTTGPLVEKFKTSVCLSVLPGILEHSPRKGKDVWICEQARGEPPVAREQPAGVPANVLPAHSS